MENSSAKNTFILFAIGGMILWGSLVFADTAASSLLPLTNFGDYHQALSGWSQQLSHLSAMIASKFDLYALAEWPFQHISEVILLVFLAEIGFVLRDWSKYM